ncbi:MAG: hypothetical protein KC636_09405 [Myxococcales bacterium]|nr:hypothetical protein [Myxococcales bacterium]
MKAGVLALATLVGGAACKHGPRPVCEAEVASPESDEALARTLTPRAWFSAMMWSYKAATRLPGEPTTDCLRRALRWEESPKGCAAPERFSVDDELLPQAPLTHEDLVVVPGPDDQLLVWAIARRYRGGDGLGPAAVVRWTKRGVALMAVGTLRAGARNPNLWIERLDAKHEVLVVESDRCDPSAPDVCTPTVQLLPIFQGLITMATLVDAEGRCLGPARFDRRRTLEVKQGRALRGFTLNSDVTIELGQITVAEQVIVRDHDPADPDALAREFRTVDDVYSIRLDPRARRFVAERAALWERVLLEDGRLDGALEEAAPRPKPRR